MLQQGFPNALIKNVNGARRRHSRHSSKPLEILAQHVNIWKQHSFFVVLATCDYSRQLIVLSVASAPPVSHMILLQATTSGISYMMDSSKKKTQVGFTLMLQRNAIAVISCKRTQGWCLSLESSSWALLAVWNHFATSGRCVLNPSRLELLDTKNCIMAHLCRTKMNKSQELSSYGMTPPLLRALPFELVDAVAQTQIYLIKALMRSMHCVKFCFICQRLT